MSDQEATRKYPLQRPPNHKPPVPRWQLVFPSDVTRVFTAYVGVQLHAQPCDAVLRSKSDLEASIKAWALDRTDDGPLASEQFTCIDGNDISGSTIWVCYWTSEASFRRHIGQLDLEALHGRAEAEAQAGIGLWYEAFTSKVARLETNYTGTDYLPGLARLPETSTAEHTLTAYWGAARDRVPDSASDRFEPIEAPLEAEPNDQRDTAFTSIAGSNNENVVHIRSGQFWETCGPEEVEAYETKLEPALEGGLQYLWNNPVDTGAMGLRYLRNSSSKNDEVPSPKRKETCVAGFFRNLDGLEAWAKSHKSHLAIYNGAMAHAKKYGPDRKFRTWHEVSILEKGATQCRYYNCIPPTGLASFLPKTPDP
ncbi:putative phenylacetaldoxime dehydratase family protein [Sarocladium strictum]